VLRSGFERDQESSFGRSPLRRRLRARRAAIPAAV